MYHRLSVTLVGLACIIGGCSSPKEERSISLVDLEDRVLGGIAGQMAGVSYGAPTEFRYCGKTVDDAITWSPDQIANSLEEDDLYVEMTFTQVLDSLGLDATMDDFAVAFANSKYALAHANAAARKHLANGIPAPLSGHPINNLHANDIDFQIESDFIGLMHPGMPASAVDLASRIGPIMNHGDGVLGGIFISCMLADAFFETDPVDVVRSGLACLPQESSYHAIIADVIALYEQNPIDWRTAWVEIEKRWNRDDICPDGAIHPLNIDAKLNGAYVAMGLLFGDTDFGRTIEIATRCGQDSDCNPSSAAGILGVMLGYKILQNDWNEWVGGLEAVKEKKFSYTDYSVSDFVQSTVGRATLVTIENGGYVADGMLHIPFQPPVTGSYEHVETGIPIEVALFSDSAWRFTGSWSVQEGSDFVFHPRAMESTSPTDSAQISFHGTGVAVVGDSWGPTPEDGNSPNGGIADIWLDGSLVATVSAYRPPGTHDSDLWHTFGLTEGLHDLLIVAGDTTDPRADNRRLFIERAIILGDPAK